MAEMTTFSPIAASSPMVMWPPVLACRVVPRQRLTRLPRVMVASGSMRKSTSAAMSQSARMRTASPWRTRMPSMIMLGSVSVTLVMFLSLGRVIG
ncbi:hypothetical protein [Nocardia shimofusensis]|uniref:hypothetical protein n=1 Tax=Nocardia shimofusensis TaxID=228596 RepID=UPI0012EDB98B|nr:hypothetical protein [Nocardia shimofusensis]